MHGDMACLDNLHVYQSTVTLFIDIAGVRTGKQHHFDASDKRAHPIRNLGYILGMWTPAYSRFNGEMIVFLCHPDFILQRHSFINSEGWAKGRVVLDHNRLES